MSKTYRHDYKGKRFNRLLVTAFVPTEAASPPMWECLCDCGKVVVVWAQSLRRGVTESCGCLNREINRSRGHHQSGGHGRKRTGAYGSWTNMMMRCEWMSHPSCESYGKAGIRVDPRWHDFRSFHADMGDRPPRHSIDRIDGSRGYGPDNCRWATATEQLLNRRTTIRVRHEGENIPAMELSARLGLSHAAVRARASRRGNDYVKGFRSLGVDVDYV